MSYIGWSIPEKVRFVKYSRLIGLIHKITKINGKIKLIFNRICISLLDLQYFNESQCIRAIRSPGKVKIAPSIPQDTAIVNFTMIFDAGPLMIEILLNFHLYYVIKILKIMEILTLMILLDLPNKLMHFH